jgi:hypothetical protein
MSIKINSIQGISTMSANVTNRYPRSNPNTNRNPLWNFPYKFQGSTAGYLAGARDGPPFANIIDKFPFATDDNATDVGDLSVARQGVAGQSSDVSGYISGGYNVPLSPFVYSNVIDKFPFASNGNTTDVGDLTLARFGVAGQSSNVSGYTSGGFRAPPSPAPLQYRNEIDKFPFATDANATDVGDLTQSRRSSAGQSSDVSGYTSGGQVVTSPTTPPAPPILVTTIDKFPFATNSNATSVGGLTRLTSTHTGQSSDVSGYTSGGYGRLPPGSPRPTSPATFRNIIDKFPFATDASATDVGDLTLSRQFPAGQSSTVSGYTSGGRNPSFNPPYSNVIDKFPFATNANATDVGDLSTAVQAVGQQN